MSVQLIVYPQYFDGSPNPLANASTQYIIDGISFTTVTSSTTFDSTASNVVQDAINNIVPTMSVNTWYRYKHPSASGVIEISNDLAIAVSSAASPIGIMQKLSNLVVGAVYNVAFDIINFSGDGVFEFRTYSGTVLQGNQIPNAVTGQTVTVQFTANTNEDIILINAIGTGVNPLVLIIDSISILAAPVQPSGATQTLENGQVICDLYEDEDIPLTLSVDEFKNAAEKVQSYSKAFKLPATKRNNQIFDNMFEVTRTAQGDVSFNPYVKTQCVLKQDGFILFEGYLRMINIIDKEGEISYNVNLYSEAIALKDFLNDRTFSELDFGELAHSYDYTEIRNSWQGLLGLTNPLPVGTYAGTAGASTTNVLKYPFVDWNHQYGFTSAGMPELPNLESTFRPFIKLNYLINRIFAATPFTWESDFFDSAHFGNLYMDFNWGADNAPTLVDDTTLNTLYLANTGTSPGYNYATTSFTIMELTINIPVLGGFVPPNYNTSTNVITSTVVGEIYTIDYLYSIENTDTVPREIECQWLYNFTPIDYSGVQTIPAGGTYNYQGIFTQFMMIAGDTLQAQFKTNSGTASKVRQLPGGGLVGGANVTFTVGALNITSGTILQTLRGELGQWDFLKGIMTMFNIITLPDKDNPNNIIFEPYGDVFISDTAGTNLSSRGIQHDWTDKVDIADMKLTPLTDLKKKSIFKFVEDDDDFCFMKYKRQIDGHLYGSRLIDASTSVTGLQTILQGTDEIIAEPFAATISAPLMPQFSDFVIPKLYSSSDDETNGFDNSPRILYSNGTKTLTSCTYSVPTQNGVSGDSAEDEFLQFSHLSTIPTVSSSATAQGTLDFHFGQCQLAIPGSNPVPDNLFNLYWLPYYAELYNEDTRIMTLKVNLNSADINTFKFNDVVMIKNRIFRVNKINYKPNDLASVEFILTP